MKLIQERIRVLRFLHTIAGVLHGVLIVILRVHLWYVVGHHGRVVHVVSTHLKLVRVNTTPSTIRGFGAYEGRR